MSQENFAVLVGLVLTAGLVIYVVLHPGEERAMTPSDTFKYMGM